MGWAGRRRATRTVPGTVFWVTLSLFVLGVVWRVVRYALAFPLWGDEAFLAVNFLSRDFAGLSRPLEFGQVAPPGFLWAELAVARMLGASEWSLRLVPFVAGVATLALFWRFCRAVSSRRTTLLAVAMLSASFFPVRHATEVKPYAVDLLVSLVVTMLGWSVWREPGASKRWGWLTAVAIVGVWCSYTAVFPIASVGVLLLARALRTERGRARSLAIAPAVAFVAAAMTSWIAMMVGFARSQQGEAPWLVSIWRDGFPPLAEPWRLPWWLVEVHTGGIFAYPYGGRTLTGLPTLVLFLVGSLALWRRPQRRPLLALLLVPLPAALAAAAMHRYPYGPSTRLTLYLAPAICLLVGEGLVALLRALGRVRRGPLIAAGLLGLVPVVCTISDVCMPYRRWDDLEYRRFVQRLAARTEPGDRWIVFDGADPLPRYPGLMTSIWVQRVAKLRFYLLSLAPVPVRWEPDARKVEPDPSGRTWLIVHDHGCAPLYPQALRAAYEPTVRARLGPSRSDRQALPIGSVVDIHVFNPGDDRLATRPVARTDVRVR